MRVITAAGLQQLASSQAAGAPPSTPNPINNLAAPTSDVAGNDATGAPAQGVKRRRSEAERKLKHIKKELKLATQLRAEAEALVQQLRQENNDLFNELKRFRPSLKRRKIGDGDVVEGRAQADAVDGVRVKTKEEIKIKKEELRMTLAFKNGTHDALASGVCSDQTDTGNEVQAASNNHMRDQESAQLEMHDETPVQAQQEVQGDTESEA